METDFLPYDKEAEKEILGACLSCGEDEEDPFYYLTEDDFYTEGGREVFQAIRAMKKINDCNHCTVRHYLATREQVGGLAVFSSVLHKYYAAPQVKYFIKILKQKSFERKLILMGNKLQDLGMWNEKFKDRDTFKSIDTLQADISKLYKDLDGGSCEDDFISFKELFIDVKREIPDRPVLVPGVTTGFDSLDLVTCGFQKDNLTYIAGRPGMGKTAFMVNSILRASEKAVKENTEGYFLIYSMEQSMKEIAIRCLSIIDNTIAGNDINRGNLNPEQRENINNICNKLGQMPILICDKPDRDYNKFETRVRRQMRTKKILGVYVDHMGQFSLPGYEKNKYSEVSEIATRLQAFCKEIHVPLIVLSQLSREVEKRNDKRPTMADLRESGRIEETGWLILLLYRDEYYNKEKSEHPGELTVIIGKNKNGGDVDINLLFNKKSLRIFEPKLKLERKETENYDTPY